MRVEKRFDAEVIARAEEMLRATVPDRKREVADQVFDAVFTPGFISEEDQFCVVLFVRPWKFRDQNSSRPSMRASAVI